MVPRVDLVGLVNNTLTAIGTGVPGVRLRIFLFQQRFASSGGYIIFAVDGSAFRGRFVGGKEKFIVLATNLANSTTAKGGHSICLVQTQIGGPGVIGTHAQARPDDPVTGGSVVHFVQIQSHGRGKAAHRVTADGNLTVALSIFGHIVLLIHILRCIPQRGRPEIKETTGILGIAAGVTVVVHIQRQNRIAPAGHFNGSLILHFGTVQVAVRSYYCGVRGGGIYILGQV